MTKVKQKLSFACAECGAQYPKWIGKCEQCSTWGTVAEIGPSGFVAGASQPLDSYGELNSHDLVPTGIDEVDRVLGGGLAAGSVILLAGEPGIGKSTLALQLAAGLSGSNKRVHLVCGEEAPHFVAARARRLGAAGVPLEASGDPELSSVLATLQSCDVLIVDSIQTMFDRQSPSAPGSVAQVRDCGAQLAARARETNTTVVVIGHVTKDGSIAGPRTLEHLVDVVLSFEGERSGGVRILRCVKNRFGTTDEVGLFEMDETGLRAIRNASEWLLANRCVGEPGSALGVLMDGRRAMVCEIQALVAPTMAAMPRRTAIGIDSQRLSVLVAVLERRAGLKLSQSDVYVSVVGGLRFDEPAADAAVCAAIASAALQVPIDPGLAVFGEVGLTGAIRSACGAEKRISEGLGVGCERILCPAGSIPKGRAEVPRGAVEVRNVGDLVAKVTEFTSVSARQNGSSASGRPRKVVD